MPSMHMSLTTEIMLMLAATAVALGSIAYAWKVYKKDETLALEDDEVESSLHRTLLNKYWIDEIYDSIIRKPVDRISAFLGKFIEPKLIDGIVEGSGSLTKATGGLFRQLQSGSLSLYIFVFILGLIAILLSL
jgi:NADH-quinone oxidoreductase subunit L